MYIYIHIYIHVYTHIHIHIYIWIYTYTYTENTYEYIDLYGTAKAPKTSQNNERVIDQKAAAQLSRARYPARWRYHDVSKPRARRGRGRLRHCQGPAQLSHFCCFPPQQTLGRHFRAHHIVFQTQMQLTPAFYRCVTFLVFLVFRFLSRLKAQRGWRARS